MNWLQRIAVEVVEQLAAVATDEPLRLSVGEVRRRLTVGPAVIGPAPDVLIQPVKRPAWDEKGWMRSRGPKGHTYLGTYDVQDRRSGRLRRFQGRIAQSGSSLDVYIADPPPEIKRHTKGPCFSLVQTPWFKLHWHRAAHDVDSAILYIERVLDESLNR